MNLSNLNDIRVFVCVVEQGSFSKAAVALDMAKSSVSRSVARLEEAIGCRLFQRSTRSTAITEAGLRYFDLVSDALTRLEDAHDMLSLAGEPQGLIRMIAPPGIGTEVLPTAITTFVHRFPKVCVDLHVSTDQTRLTERRFDLAIQGGVQPDSSMVIKKLHASVFHLYASPSYLKRAGTPQSLKELESHTCVLFRHGPNKNIWRLEDTQNRRHEVQVRGPISCNDLVALRRCAIAGAGIVLLPEVPAQWAIEQGLLSKVLPQYAMKTSHLFLISPSNQHVPKHVQLFRDFLLEHFPDVDDINDTTFRG